MYLVIQRTIRINYVFLKISCDGITSWCLAISSFWRTGIQTLILLQFLFQTQLSQPSTILWKMETSSISDLGQKFFKACFTLHIIITFIHCSALPALSVVPKAGSWIYQTFSCFPKPPCTFTSWHRVFIPAPWFKGSWALCLLYIQLSFLCNPYILYYQKGKIWGTL